MRLWTLLVVLVVACMAACGGSDRVSGSAERVPSATETTQGVPSSTTSAATSPSTTAAATTTTSTAATSTSASAASSSTTTLADRGLPPFFRYGSFGVIKTEDGTETLIVDEPVASVWSDGVGGLVFSYHWLAEVPALWRLMPGMRDPSAVTPESVWGGTVVNLDGRAAIVRSDAWEDRLCESGSIGVYDLETGQRNDFVQCAGEGDVGWFPTTYGGGLFSGVRQDAVGSCGTDSGILFWDQSGADVRVATNPYPMHSPWGDATPEWIPCELDARLSADGRLLAYRFRPDNKWPCPEYDDVPYEDWLEGSRNIRGEVVVLDLGTGAEVFRADSPAEERLADFDGRFLVLTTADRRDDVPLNQRDWSYESRIVDVTAANPDHNVDGRVRLVWTATG